MRNLLSGRHRKAFCSLQSHFTSYRPRSEASEGYVFTGVCHSVTKRGGGGRWATLMVNHLPPRTMSECLPPPPHPPGTRSECIPPSPSPLGTRSECLPPSPPTRTRSECLPPGTRSECLPPPQDQVRMSTPPGPGHNVYPLPPGPGQNVYPPRTRS